MALPIHNFLSHLDFFKVGEIMLLKYENLMLPAEHILDLYCVRLSNAAVFSENYTKLYFNAKRLEKGFIIGGRDGDKSFSALFSESTLFGQYRMLP